MTFQLSPKAISDIQSVTTFIGRDSKRAAQQWAVDVTEKFRIIGRSPKIGVLRPELGQTQRTFPFGNYLIFYRELSNGVEVLRVLHAARHWQDLF